MPWYVQVLVLLAMVVIGLLVGFVAATLADGGQKHWRRIEEERHREFRDAWEQAKAEHDADEELARRLTSSGVTEEVPPPARQGCRASPLARREMSPDDRRGSRPAAGGGLKEMNNA